MSVSIVHIFTPADGAWDELFRLLPPERRDVFYTSAFGRLCQSTLNRNDEVLCAAQETSTGAILYPFALRNLETIVGSSGAGLRDMVGLYGRNGIACSTTDASSLSRFHAGISEFALRQRAICSFDRFHPIFSNERQCAGGTQIIDVGNFIVVDLNPDVDVVEHNYKYSLRKDINKAIRNGVSTFVDSGPKYLRHFVEIYTETMFRNSARDFYHFDMNFFETLLRELHGHYLFFFAVVNEQIVSCELVLIEGQYAHSFLGGTRQPALPLAANQLLKRDLIREIKSRGCRYYLLGGGLQRDDGIEKYKRAFAPDGMRASVVGGLVFDSEAMAALDQHPGITKNPKRFQFYDPN
jgi:hypothetical protein